MKKLCCMFLIINLLLCFSSCKEETYYEKDVALLNSDSYYIQFNIPELANGYLAKRDDKYSFMLDDTVLICSSDDKSKVCGILLEDNVYFEDTIFDINYKFFNTMFNKLKVKNIESENNLTTIYCQNFAKQTIKLIYKDNVLGKIYISMIGTDFIEANIVSLSQNIPDDVLFEAPEKFEKVDRSEYYYD